MLPWPVLADGPSDPAVVGRLGPVLHPQAVMLALDGSLSPATQWRVVLTDDDGCALAVATMRLAPEDTGAARATPGTTAVVGRVTVTVRASQTGLLDTASQGYRRADGRVLTTRRQVILRAASVAARTASRRYEEERAADAAGGGQCAHSASTGSYVPSPRLREYVMARDVTCRHVTCGQPAWRGDLDHTIPWDAGGRSCRCNLGPICRTHHKVKQLPGWQLEQVRPGWFRWTTPAGLSYDVGPDPYPV